MYCMLFLSWERSWRKGKREGEAEQRGIPGFDIWLFGSPFFMHYPLCLDVAAGGTGALMGHRCVAPREAPGHWLTRKEGRKGGMRMRRVDHLEKHCFWNCGSRTENGTGCIPILHTQCHEFKNCENSLQLMPTPIQLYEIHDWRIRTRVLRGGINWREICPIVCAPAWPYIF